MSRHMVTTTTIATCQDVRKRATFDSMNRPINVRGVGVDEPSSKYGFL